MSVLIFLTARSAGRILRYLPNILNSIPFTTILNTDSGFGIAEKVENSVVRLFECHQGKFFRNKNKHTSYFVILADDFKCVPRFHCDNTGLTN